MGQEERRSHPLAPAIRVLFASQDWPCGVLDVGSWAHRQVHADVRIAPLREDSPFAVPPELYRDMAARLELWPHEERRLTTDEVLQTLGVPLTEMLIQWRPHVVGFRIESGQFDRVADCVRAVRTLSDATIVLGGPTVTSHPVETLLESGADFAFAGEAEETFAAFLRLARKPFSKDNATAIPGLAYQWGDRFYINRSPRDGYGRSLRPNGVHDSDIPKTSADVLQANVLDWPLLSRFEEEPFDSLYFTGGRGCPGECAFCAQLHGKRVRVKPAQQLLDEIGGADHLVQEGRLKVSQWPLFQYAEDDELRNREVAWASIYDEDFFLIRQRAVEFFALWARSDLRRRYRLSVQTNPCSLLNSKGEADPDVLRCIDELKPMIQVGAESFHPEMLRRWRKRHSRDQLMTVLRALETTGQDYTVFHILADYESTPDEVLDTVWLLARAAVELPRMRIASNGLMIPLYDSDLRRKLEFASRPRFVGPLHFTEYEAPHVEWMHPLAAELADVADQSLQGALYPETRNEALLEAMNALAELLRDHDTLLHDRAQWMIQETEHDLRS